MNRLLTGTADTIRGKNERRMLMIIFLFRFWKINNCLAQTNRPNKLPALLSQFGEPVRVGACAYEQLPQINNQWQNRHDRINRQIHSNHPLSVKQSHRIEGRPPHPSNCLFVFLRTAVMSTETDSQAHREAQDSWFSCYSEPLEGAADVSLSHCGQTEMCNLQGNTWKHSLSKCWSTRKVVKCV